MTPRHSLEDMDDRAGEHQFAAEFVVTDVEETPTKETTVQSITPFQRMTPAAQSELNIACLRLGLTVDGWQHYLTSMGDDAVSRFYFDNEDGSELVVQIAAEGRTYKLNGTQVEAV